MSNNLQDALVAFAAAMNDLRDNPTGFGEVNAMLEQGSLSALGIFLNAITNLPGIISTTYSLLATGYTPYANAVLKNNVVTLTTSTFSNLTDLSISLAEFSSSISLTPAEFISGLKQVIVI